MTERRNWRMACGVEDIEVSMRYWLAVSLILFGCAVPVAAGEAEPPAGPPDESRVVARVQGTEITYQDLKSRIQILEREQGPIPPERYAEILHGMVREEVLLHAAAGERLEQRPLVKARLEQVRRHVLIDELLKQKLVALGEVTDEEIRKVYEENKTAFTRDAPRVSHIMVPDEAEAEAIRNEAVAGKDFATLAREKSQDAGSAEKGGDLGILAPGLAEPEFEQAAGKLSDGEISPVVKTQQGYHILKGGGREKVVEPLENVRDRLKEMLAQQKQREVILLYVTTLETTAKPEVFEDRLP
ncbi:MAG: peptidylprolyl isomerase [candidate division NC10 bacterium]|nr:peptidylprolyl isomerase [candidate division NC10 bacterium]